jgi:hypothetical protein
LVLIYLISKSGLMALIQLSPERTATPVTQQCPSSAFFTLACHFPEWSVRASPTPVVQRSGLALKEMEPTWRGFKKFPHVFGAHAIAGGATRKRAVVACARLLAIDLWRLQTGRVTLENLGLKPAQSQ